MMHKTFDLSEKFSELELGRIIWEGVSYQQLTSSHPSYQIQECY